MPRGYQVAAALALAGLSVGCEAPPSDSDSDPPVVDAVAAPREALPIVLLRIEPPVVTGPRAVERAGLVTALFELGMTDIEGVVPQVSDLPPSPGLRDLVLTGHEEWTATLTMDIKPWQATATVCDPRGDCRDHTTSAGSAEAPWPAVAVLLHATSARTLRAPAEGAADGWLEPISGDEYAILVAGRSAATFYGMREQVRESAIGDPRRDSISRASFIDPGMAVAGWILARREIAEGRSVTGRGLLVRAALARPTSVVLVADEGAALTLEEKHDAATRVWRSVRRRGAEDLRFVAPGARAALAHGDLDEAERILGGWTPKILSDRAVAELRVSLAESGRRLAAYDDLLKTWQEADPLAAEPVRRRIRIRVRRGAYQQALDMLGELVARDGRDEAQQLEIALLAALGRFDQAASQADASGRPEVARRLRARAALTRSPNAVPAPLEGDLTREARLAAGHARLRARDTAGALRDAAAVLAVAPYDAEALELRALAAEAAGDPTASKARAAFTAVRPQGSFVSPRTVAGSTGTKLQVQSAP